MKKIFLTLTILALFIKTVNAQEPYVQISGKIDTSIINYFHTKELYIKLYDPVKKLLNEEEIITVAIQEKGKFNVKIKCANPSAYLSFWTKKENEGLGEMLPVQFQARNISLLDEWYLFEQGDSVKMYINKDGNIGFSGHGAEKLKVQGYIFNLPDLQQAVQRRSIDLINSRQFDQANELEEEAYRLEVMLRKKLIESYAHELSPKLCHQIELDAISNTAYSRLRSNTLVPGDNNQDAIKKYYQQYLITNPTKINDQNGSQSPYYLAYLYLKELSLYSTFKAKKGNNNFGTEFVNILKEKYTPDIRDQLLLLMAGKSSTELVKPVIDSIIDLAQQKEIKTGLRKWKERQFSKAYPFELEDEHGKQYSLKDFKGKLLVMDFWFTGCPACRNLNAAMTKITDWFKGNKDIIFITVSSDKKKAIWKQSIQTKQYTQAEGINLYTNGLGVTHPMLKYYNFQGAPRQLIIDKNGYLISSDPPRADLDMQAIDPSNMSKRKDSNSLNLNTEAFIKLIEQHL